MPTVLAIAGLVVGLLGLIAGALALRTLGRLRRSLRLLHRGSRHEETFLEAAARHVETSLSLQADLGAIRADLTAQRDSLDADVSADRAMLAQTVQQLSDRLDNALRRVALVRFDAFDDLAGRQSFCVALLDGHGDGLALTSIAGRADTRTYVKPINGGVSEHDLSPEEHRAVTAALAA